MHVVIHVNHLGHQQSHGEALRKGLERHGITAEFAAYNVPRPCDVAVIWGWKQPKVIEAGRNILVMERGHVGDRMTYSSMGWNGLAGRGTYPKAPDGERWNRLWGDLMQPWRPQPHHGRALLIGQVPGDAALYGLDLDQWAAQTAAKLQALGWQVTYRPHPLAVRGNCVRVPPLCDRSSATLAEDLAAHDVCVTFSSTTGVESVLAGVPTVTLDRGSMAWPVAHQSLNAVGAPLYARTEWAHDLAWTQWSMDEIASGDAWDHLKGLV